MPSPRPTERSKRDNDIFSMYIKSYSNENDFVTFKRSINHVVLKTRKWINLFKSLFYSACTVLEIGQNSNLFISLIFLFNMHNSHQNNVNFLNENEVFNILEQTSVVFS